MSVMHTSKVEDLSRIKAFYLNTNAAGADDHALFEGFDMGCH